mmetsp:Transcript_19053/g.53096  ORF Transcript_19053/g.53096 Transcript_19053/m.53096 type:complete len:251 (-) Transcript_19053:4168-4920(-)
MKAPGSELYVAILALASTWDGMPSLADAFSTSDLRTISTVHLGYQDKAIDMFIPEKSNDHSSTSAATGKRPRKNYKGPSNFALSQLIAHCPSLVDERNVLELGSGLGMVSAVACKYSRPNHVAITDRDKSLLSLAYASCVQLQRSKASVSRCCMDWQQPSTWPQQEYDMLLGADILHDKRSISSLVNVIQHYLCNESKPGTRRQAVIVDPVKQVNRNKFSMEARRAGLIVDQTEFPGSPDLVLLSISPSL